MIFTRYEIITNIIQNKSGDNAMPLTEKDRSWIASFPDSVLFETWRKPQFKELRKGFYVLN